MILNWDQGWHQSDGCLCFLYFVTSWDQDCLERQTMLVMPWLLPAQQEASGAKHSDLTIALRYAAMGPD